MKPKALHCMTNGLLLSSKTMRIGQLLEQQILHKVKPNRPIAQLFRFVDVCSATPSAELCFDIDVRYKLLQISEEVQKNI